MGWVYSHKVTEKGKMENEKPENKEIEVIDVEIGEDKPQVIAKRVVIEGTRAEIVKFDKEESKKLILKVRHPDVKDLIEISGAKYQQGDKLKTSGLWLKLDNEGKLPFKSAVGNLLRFLKKTKLSEIKGEQIDTITDDAGYLVVKAY